MMPHPGLGGLEDPRPVVLLAASGRPLGPQGERLAPHGHSVHASCAGEEGGARGAVGAGSNRWPEVMSIRLHTLSVAATDEP